MIRFFAKWRAKRKYVWKELFEAEITELQARLSLQRADEKRALATKLTAQADAIEAYIKTQEGTPEYLALAGQEKYEADREKNEAKKMVADYRQQAKNLEPEIENHKATAKLLQNQARAGRDTAERLQRL